MGGEASAARGDATGRRTGGGLDALDVRPACAVALVAFVVYVATLYPDVAGGDSGELVGAVGSGGVIHPPGYPAYALLGLVFAHLPLRTLAWRLNLLSAACDAAAAALVFLTARLVTRSRGGAVAAAAVFAFAPGVWRYAIAAEVFALDNLFVALLVLLAVLYATEKDRRFAIAGAFALGLGLSNHQTILFTGVPLVAWLLWEGRKELLAPRVLARLVLAGALGLLPYLYLPLLARHHAVVTWGAADTWSGFWTHVLRKEYGTFQLAPTGIAGPGASGVETLGAWLDDAREGLGWPGLLLALAGVALCARDALARSKKRRARGRSGLAFLGPLVLSVGVMATLGNLPVSDALHRGIVARFWQQPEVFVALFSGLGVAGIGRLGSLGEKVTLPLGAAIAAVALGLHYREMDRSRSMLVRSYGAEILRAAPPGALLFTKGDLITNTVRYLQLAEKVRPDVRVVDQELLGLAWMKPEVLRLYPDVVIPGERYMPGAPGGFTMKSLLDANVDRSVVLVCGGVKAGDLSAGASYGFWPWGLCERPRKGTEPVSLDAWVEESEAALPRIAFTGQPHPVGSWEGIVWGDYWEVREARAVQLMNVAGRDETKRRYIAQAAVIMAGVVADNPDVAPHFYKNYATALGRSGLATPDDRRHAADAWERYLAGGNVPDTQRAAIEQEIRRLRQTVTP